MRAFSTLIVAAALTLTANAAAVEKRAVSSPVQLCINDINAVADQLAVVTTTVNAFTSASGYAGAITVHTKEQTLETALKKAGTDCCAISGTETDEEAKAVLTVVSKLVPQVTTALTAIRNKKSQFDAVTLATSIVKTDIKALDSLTSTLDTCLVAKTPSSYLSQANGYVAQITAAFTATKSTYGV